METSEFSTSITMGKPSINLKCQQESLHFKSVIVGITFFADMGTRLI
jgi:hypothetical protein